MTSAKQLAAPQTDGKLLSYRVFGCGRRSLARLASHGGPGKFQKVPECSRMF